ncbi:MAG: DUF1365 family protein [Paraglaciecola sp.]
MQSAIYKGTVHHSRYVPKKHAFSYKIFLLWLDLDEIPEVEKQVRGFSHSFWSPLRFKREDYLGDPKLPLKQSVLQKMSQLAGKSLDGQIFLLGQVRTFGLYFSPVNFYYLRHENGHFSHLLAEVSNTPWDQRHCYLVDLDEQKDCAKMFHVSPFNPMDMQYKWQISQPEQKLTLTLSCYKDIKHFVASMNLIRQELNSSSLTRVLLTIPSMTVKTVLGIYWQALKLFLKRLPVYANPTQGKK